MSEVTELTLNLSEPVAQQGRLSKSSHVTCSRKGGGLSAHKNDNNRLDNDDGNMIY